MFIKRYLVNDMQEAMAKIRSELGEDAVILNSRMVRQKGLSNLFKKKRLEVVAAYDSKIKKKHPILEARENASPAAAAASVENEKIDKLTGKLEDLQKTVAMLAEKFEGAAVQKDEKEKYSPEVAELYEKLLESDVVPEIAQELAESTEKAVKDSEDEPGGVMAQLIAEKLGEASPVRIKKYKRNVIVFLGPTGVGKTTTLVKIAGYFVTEEGLKVGVINTDTFRVAANEQLKIYTDIMEIPLDTAYTAEELKEALKKQEDRELILMDTAGKNLSDGQYKEDIEKIIEICEPDELYITLSLTTGYKALKDIIDNLSFVKEYKVILTKLDEVSTWGNILNFADYAGKPLSYITDGQNIPDDIEQANPAKIAASILK